LMIFSTTNKWKPTLSLQAVQSRQDLKNIARVDLPLN
jgi:hypothetical protein